MASIPVAYGGADLLKVSVSFNYDYYIVYREQAKDSTSTSTDNSLVTEESLNRAIELGFPIIQSGFPIPQ